VPLPNDGRCGSSDEAKATAQRVIERFATRIAPGTASPAHLFTQLLQLLAFAPPTHGRLLANPATHDALMAALERHGVPYEEAGDSAGDFVVIQLCRGHSMHISNPLGPGYGYDWELMGIDVGPMLANTWREDPDTVAKRIQSLLAILATGYSDAANR
jgi:hypothetical protein